MATRNSTRSCTNRKKVPTFNLFFLLPATKILNLFKMFHFYHEIQIWFLAGKNFIVSSSVIITQVVFLQRTFSRLVFFNFPLWTSESFFSNLNFNSSRSLPLWFRTFCAAFAVSAEKKPRKKCIILWREMEIYGVKNWVGKFCCNTKSSSSCYHKFQLKFLI